MTAGRACMLVSGQGPFDPALIAARRRRSAGRTGSERLRAAAAQRDWRAEMVWYESVNRRSSGRAGAAAATDYEEPPRGRQAGRMTQLRPSRSCRS